MIILIALLFYKGIGDSEGTPSGRIKFPIGLTVACGTFGVWLVYGVQSLRKKDKIVGEVP